jgi:hypothetical protein
MKGNPAVSGSLLTSKPTWSNTSGCFATSAFLLVGAKRAQSPRRNRTDKTKATMAQQIARAAIAFEQRRTGSHVHKAVTVILSEGTLVITLHEALSPAEKEQPESIEGSARGLHRSGAARRTGAHRYLGKRLRASLPAARIVVGQWGLKGDVEHNREQLLEAGADRVETTLLETRAHLQAWLPVRDRGASPTTAADAVTDEKPVAV